MKKYGSSIAYIWVNDKTSYIRIGSANFKIRRILYTPLEGMQMFVHYICIQLVKLQFYLLIRLHTTNILSPGGRLQQPIIATAFVIGGNYSLVASLTGAHSTCTSISVSLIASNPSLRCSSEFLEGVHIFTPATLIGCCLTPFTLCRRGKSAINRSILPWIVTPKLLSRYPEFSPKRTFNLFKYGTSLAPRITSKFFIFLECSCKFRSLNYIPFL